MRFGLRELIFLVVLLAVPVASAMYVFKPRSEDIQQIEKEVTEKEIKLDRLEEVASKISDIKQAIIEGEKDIQLIEAKLPSEKEVEVILEQIWQIASSNGLSVKSIKSEANVPAAMYRELPLRMVIDGSFDGFYQFLLELENLPRITRVPELTLSRVKNKKGGPNMDDLPEGWMTAEFLLSIFFQPQAERMAQVEN